MPKDTREVFGSVRAKGKVFTNDDLDELEAALTLAEKKRLTEKGVIKGFVKEDPKGKEK